MAGCLVCYGKLHSSEVYSPPQNYYSISPQEQTHHLYKKVKRSCIYIKLLTALFVFPYQENN